MKDNLVNNLNQIRRILESNDNLNIFSTKNSYEISIEFNRIFQIKCLIHQSIDLLIIKNLDDLNIYQLENFKFWFDIRNYFYRLIQQSDSYTSLYLIIQLIKEYISIFSRQNSSLLPEKCQIITWNIHSNENLYSLELKQLKISLPDIICLQNVTQTFLDLLSKEIWFDEHQYIRIPADNCSINGQLILLKNIRPELIEIEENQYILVRLRLKNKTNIDLINIHLRNYNENSLEKLFKKFQNNNTFLIGNFGLIDNDDDNNQQENFPFIDLWKEFYDIDEYPDSTLNRYYLCKHPDLSYSIENFVPISLESNRISNHFGLQLFINFRVRTISKQSALVILSEDWIYLFESFIDLNEIEDDQEDILLPLRLQLSQLEKFDRKLYQPLIYIQNLFEIIRELFSSFLSNQQLNISIEQIFQKFSLANIQNIQYVYLIKKQTNKIEIIQQIPIGCVLEPIQWMNLDELSNSINKKQDKYQRISNVLEKYFNQNQIDDFEYKYLPYGSFRLGLDGEDLDTVLVVYGNARSKSESLRLTNYFLDFLQKQLNSSFKNELIECRIIQAIYPILSLVFYDETKVDIFVQVILNEQIHLCRTIHGIHDLERLIIYVRYPNIFQYILTFIRRWAQTIGIYGQVYGYLGGYSWAILCAFICRKYIPTYLSNFSLDDLQNLIRKFFIFYSDFDWSSKSLSLYPKHFSKDFRGSMRILCPTQPYNNTARSTINSTCYLITQAFRYASEKSLSELFQMSHFFPDQRIQSVLQLILSGQTITELNQWIGYMKSRLAHLLIDCENNCNLFVQTDTKLIQGKHSFERIYSIGFDQNEQILSRHREFYYSLNRFFDQFKNYSFRKETMTISYKLISIKDFLIK